MSSSSRFSTNYHVNEATFNTVVAKSARASGGDGYKIPDSGGQGIKTAKQPFDGFGVLVTADGPRPLYWESKFNKSAGSFNLNRIEDHQARWLTTFSSIQGSLCYVVLGVHVARGDLRAYVWDWRYLGPLYEGGKSFWWKELETLPFNPVKKDVFEFKNVLTTSP